jgi:superfamily II DNA or RNA helicase|tara:strand:- start:1464 stop:2825 length:1362 start_codon:yes stop_codon:yes gene_type:complete
MELHINTINSQLVTDNPKLLKALHELYSFKVPGAEYSPQYKRHSWNGKKSFFTKKGVFKTGLLDRVICDLKKVDADPTIIDNRSFSQETTDYQFSGITYYDYQEKTIQHSVKEKRSIIKAPTAAGKTIIMAGLIKALQGRKMLLLFNAKQLLTQTYDFLLSLGIPDLGLCFSEGFIQGDIMLCTVQSIEKVLDTHSDTEVLMVDECHEFSNGKTTVAAIQAFAQANYRFGFTATPPNQDISRFNLEGGLGPVYSVATTKDLVEKGKLTKPIIQIIERPYTAKNIDESMTYADIYDEFIVNNETRNNTIKDIVNDIKNKNKTARILILTKSLDHGRALENLLGGHTEFLEGANSIGERYKAISRFRGRRGPSILIGTKILQTGINIEEITHLINARGMKSEIATLQALGRALRTHESKDTVYVYDFLDQEKYLLEHSKEREKHYRAEGHEVKNI